MISFKRNQRSPSPEYALRAGDRFLVAATRPRTNDPKHDVLDFYAQELSAAGATDGSPTARLIALFTVMLGLGMRESSGRHCAGPDTPVDRGVPGHPVPTTPENAEAGLFQVSHDSIAGHADRQALVDAYSGRTDLLAIFSEGAGCTKPDHWPADVGTGPAAAFQAQTKECPLFAALFTAFLLRELRGEWGPINRREAETKKEAVALFTSIQAIVDAE